MNLGNILGQILQQGMSNQGRSRLDHAVGSGGIGDLLGGLLGGSASAGGSQAGGGGLGDLLGGMLGGGGSAGASGGMGGLGDLLGGGAIGSSPSPRPTSPSGGGIGDLLGGLLGGGAGSSSSAAPSSGGSAGMAILATIAMAALKNWTDKRREQAAAGGMPGFAPDEVEAMASPETEQLVLRAMISAAKADGELAEDEIQRIVGKIGADGLSEDERQFIISELRQPLDLAGLVRDVPNAAVAAEVYAASLLAIELDTPAEMAYMRQLAQALQLDGDTVSRLHQITGAVAV